MILEKNNLKEWKSCLDKEMKSQYNLENFSECNADQYWIDEYTGYDTQNAIDDESDYFEE